MKLYRVTWSDEDFGTMVEWHTTKRAAEKVLREQIAFRDRERMPDDGIEVKDVPTTRAEIAKFLNNYANRDNG